MPSSRAGPGGRAGRVVREAAGADLASSTRSRRPGRRPGASSWLGFNRRWAPAVLAAQRLAGGGAPRRSSWSTGSPRAGSLTATGTSTGARAAGCSARCATSSIPRRRWSGADIEEPSGAGRRPRRGDGRWPATTLVVALRFADGSVATICYGSAAPAAGKERIEVLPDPGAWSSTTSGPASSTAGRSGRAARTRATAPTPPHSGRRCTAARPCRPRPCWPPCAPPSRRRLKAKASSEKGCDGYVDEPSTTSTGLGRM